jgi:glucosamine--fructose-6-phosphate aminotransferase (isomerizing)
MCGIVGYVGPKPAVSVLMDGLSSLEYRGYDSAGLAILDGGSITILRRVGKLANLRSALELGAPEGIIGIGHTRWATHGHPNERNAHPHTDCTGRIAVVHNGIIENYVELRDELVAIGHEFKSQTDTETIAHLVESYYEGDLGAAVLKAIGRLDGSFALSVVHTDHADRIVAARKDSPLILGLGVGENFVASDIPAVLRHTREIGVLKDGQVVTITAEGVELIGGDPEIEVLHVDWDLTAAEKGGYEDFMLKEIFEQPRSIRETLRGRLADDGTVQLSELAMSAQDASALDRVYIVACGTSFHAGLVAKSLIEKWARIPVEIQVASEFRYNDPIIDDTTLVVAISQSGETADTLAGVREAHERGARVVAISNVVGSSITREADGVIYTHAGPEIGVAATKTFTAQIAALYVLALFLAQVKGCLEVAQVRAFFGELERIPEVVEEILEDGNLADLIAAADMFANVSSSLFLGRGLGVPIAMEGALKLKEISYIHAEAYAAGEMKHGPIALITDRVPVVAIATRSAVYEKVVSNLQEVRARDAKVIVVATRGDEVIGRHAEHVLWVPLTHEDLSPIPAVVPLQLLAYYIAKKRGCDVDQPRNLAKSVTVE